jgi:hypothetical protein
MGCFLPEGDWKGLAAVNIVYSCIPNCHYWGCPGMPII